jgi:hypothetical protein
MSELEELYAEILAYPERDAPRVRYAEVVGGARAEFIREGIVLRDLHRRRAWAQYVLPTQAKLAALLRKHPEWSGDVLRLVASLEFGRGFVERVTLPAAAFLARAAELYSKAPILHARLTDASGSCEALAASPHLERLRSLDLSSNSLEDRDAEALAASPHLGRLRWLDLSRNRIADRGLEALAAATKSRFPELRYVGFALNRASDPSDQSMEDEGGVVTFRERPQGDALEAKYGELPWLHFNSEIPPHPECVL